MTGWQVGFTATSDDSRFIPGQANEVRAIVKQTGAGTFEIIGKFQGDGLGDRANAEIIERLIDDYTP